MLMLGSSLTMAGCQATSKQMKTALTVGVGAVAGGLIASQGRGGAGAVVAGALIGAVASAILSKLIDDIERNNARNAIASSARSGGNSTRSFRNSRGERVVYRTQTLRTYDCGGDKCREISSSVSRNGVSEDLGSSTVRVKSNGTLADE